MTKDRASERAFVPAASSQQAVSPVPASIPDAGWILHFDQAPGQRVLGRGFLGITVGWAEEGETMWWDYDNRRWIADSVFPWGKNNPERTFTAGATAPCNSFKAFKRHLRKHRKALEGRKVRLVSRFLGHDVVATPSHGETQ